MVFTLAALIGAILVFCALEIYGRSDRGDKEYWVPIGGLILMILIAQIIYVKGSLC